MFTAAFITAPNWENNLNVHQLMNEQIKGDLALQKDIVHKENHP